MIHKMSKLLILTTTAMLALCSCAKAEVTLQEYVETQPAVTTVATVIETEAPFNAWGVYIKEEAVDFSEIDYNSYRDKPVPDCIKVSNSKGDTTNDEAYNTQQQICIITNLCFKFNGITLNPSSYDEFDNYVRSSSSFINYEEDVENETIKYNLKEGNITFVKGYLQHIDAFMGMKMLGFSVGDNADTLKKLGNFNIKKDETTNVMMFDPYHSAELTFTIRNGKITGIQFDVVETEINDLYTSLEDIGYAPITKIPDETTISAR